MLSPDATVSPEVGRHMFRAAFELAQLPPVHLASFLQAYLIDRAKATQDIEDLTDPAGDAQIFAVADRIVTIAEPEFIPDGPMAPDGLNDRPAPVRLGSHSDGSPCFDDDRICY